MPVRSPFLVHESDWKVGKGNSYTLARREAREYGSWEEFRRAVESFRAEGCEVGVVEVRVSREVR
jgi:hypothetical protein